MIVNPDSGISPMEAGLYRQTAQGLQSPLPRVAFDALREAKSVMPAWMADAFHQHKQKLLND